MEGTGIAFGVVLLSIAFIVLVIFLEWKLGKFLGNSVSRTTGLILGVILVLCGFTLFIAIPCIIHSQKNKEKSLDLNFNIKSNVDTNRISNVQETSSALNSDTRECPFCAETIKKAAKICRFCGKEVEPII
ncbi:hypothetical protein TREPR_3645 [Treponema primitia ZAS-2]|uniref:Zinc-ribbon domain-containing protein n=1 Tax=Treponema primitia (strain ATCC BAA-887 / DSM 12427 / ZAS-2) TaxID=545694 RepID=F5YQY2_TREPZ|nr:hypothetical protein [Treponema primitia]AEF84091.1 hypothetical protein TREPR_3645 [Treponema primitia ZAS-2]